ncbi:MAG: polyhydroxyalkanoate synthesis regulator DNA-binding domain-containing protein [Cardiobacteriaceae bacterium]|nr:polyhydroxyalkanoate synthesis regulator DNA-binding domain-containing protein [Cardiobacteriaceae bacterium]
MSRLIKKYPNRRLYDTQESRYISNEYVRDLVRSGQDVRIVEASTGIDITRSVFLLLLAELDANHEAIFSKALLREVLRYQDPLLQGLLGQYLEKSLQVFLQHQQLFLEQMQDFDGMNPMETLNHLVNCQSAFLMSLDSKSGKTSA